MYESITFDSILDAMLTRVPNSVDKREGSVIYDALAPAAIELQKVYIELDAVLNEMFADTAGREYLIKRAAERGLSPTEATYAVWKGEFNLEIPIGSRFSLGEYNFIVTERMAGNTYKLQCEQAGVGGNEAGGTLIPIEYLPGLQTAELTELLIPGEDEEDTEHFRKRYFNHLNSQAFGGNIADYKEKVNLIAGVGGVKVYPVWNGGGTVKLVIVDSRYQAPSGELVEQVQNTIDPPLDSGKGYGLAPIDHKVTVVGAGTEEITITVQIVYQEGWDFESCAEAINEAIDAYFMELNQNWEEEECLVVRSSQIISRLLEITGVLDVTLVEMNGEEGNYQVPADNVVKRGDVNGS